MTEPSSPSDPSTSQSPAEKTRPSREPNRDDAGRPPTPGPWGLFVVLAILIALYLMWARSPSNYGTTVGYDYVFEQVTSGNVAEAKFHGDVVTGKLKKTSGVKEADDPPRTEFNTTLPMRDDEVLLNAMREHGVKITAESQQIGVGGAFIFWMLPPLLIIGFFWYMMRRNSDTMGAGMLNSFGRSPARRFKSSDQQVTFDDVAALEQAKAELQEVVEFLKNPGKFQRLGAQIPKGVLLMGSPGTGKTLLARATAGEAGVPFFSINGSEFIQMFVGVGASRVRDMFKVAKDSAPCLLFIDEIDAVGRVRGAGLGGGHDEREQTLNQILSEMDGFTPSEAVIVVAATNRPDVLDPALLRPGRFDRHITVDRPNQKGRLAIIKVHCRKVPLSDNVDLNAVAAGTIGFSGAELKNLVNEAALNACRFARDSVTMDDFESARDRVLMGPEREDILQGHERDMTAYHEAGHALMAWMLPELDPVHKVSIIPRGRALGVTQLLPNEERYNIGEKRLHSQLAFMLGGRAAEKMVFDEYSAGAEDDLKRATQTARRMVTHWGMSEVIGPVAFRGSDEHPFLGKEIHEQREFSDETARQIDEEIQKFLRAADDQAREMLAHHRGKLEELSQRLLDAEVLDQAEMTTILGDRPPEIADNGTEGTPADETSNSE